ncbi:hypothetical protein ILUMI_08294 [Ignelater luminosus]|uniref:Transposase Tc1-like domain-containing protein n=1 Tax=Ignelater luminosus TaxID=2038154 RepID=A0A8K0DBL1_IGNLU|nr:hypothetical protein ILUMI_08294 [Ignelater luminosus]
MCKSKITAADRRALRRIIEKNHRVSYLQLSSLWSDAVGRHILRSTCHREAHKMGFSTYKAKEKPLLTPLQKQNRLVWAKQHKNWTPLNNDMQYNGVIRGVY